MATTLQNTTAVSHGATTDIKGAMQRLQERFTKYRHYRQTVKELSSLSDRDLADMGMGRSFIKRTAIEAVYGTKDI